MKFTEPEMTAAVEAAARHLFVATRPPWRRASAEAAWDALSRVEKYHRKSAAGEMVLPALVALPERPTVGARPEFTADEYVVAAEEAARQALERGTPGGWEQLPERRRKAHVRATAALTRLAVAGMPVRQDPDGLVVPDHP